jgi:hypothetical protein
VQYEREILLARQLDPRLRAHAADARNPPTLHPHFRGNPACYPGELWGVGQRTANVLQGCWQDEYNGWPSNWVCEAPRHPGRKLRPHSRMGAHAAMDGAWFGA